MPITTVELQNMLVSTDILNFQKRGFFLIYINFSSATELVSIFQLNIKLNLLFNILITNIDSKIL